MKGTLHVDLENKIFEIENLTAVELMAIACALIDVVTDELNISEEVALEMLKTIKEDI